MVSKSNSLPFHFSIYFPFCHTILRFSFSNTKSRSSQTNHFQKQRELKISQRATPQKMQNVSPLWRFIHLFFLIRVSFAITFTLTNNCPYTIWPGTLAGAGTPQLPMTGFQLNSGGSVQIPATPGWSGRLWARTGCTFDGSGIGTCQTGDCGGKLECSGMGATPPASLFEITLGNGDGLDFYDVSIVDGYNIPLVATPHAVSGGCNATGCVADINMGCPKELQVISSDMAEYDNIDGRSGRGVVACKSACEAFGLDQYCCSGEFANPTTCKPSFYSSIFKRACPTAYSYAFDDGTSTFTCKAYDYSIVFCPTFDRENRSNETLQGPLINQDRHSKGEIPDMVYSSSNILLPISLTAILPIGTVLKFFF